MDSVINELNEKSKSHTNNSLIQATIAYLTDAQRSGTYSWDAVRRDFDTLEAEGVWETSDQHTKLLSDLRSFMTLPDAENTPADVPAQASPNGRRQENSSIVLPPPAPATSPFLPSVDPTILPLELVEILNHTYFLHVLATDPTKVLPPGKSLLSVLSRPRSENDHASGSAPSLQAKVEDMVHKAFWDEALESLSKAEPSIQLPRLKLLYQDLEAALTPLLPPGHPVLVTLSSQLSPTSSPLHSAISRLREILASLRNRCAPARDGYIDQLLLQLSDPLPATSLAGLVTKIVKSTLDLAEAMKDDLSQFVLGSMGEKQLKVLITQQARTQEINVVLQLWRPEAIQQKWTSWIEDIRSPYRDIGGNISALGKLSLRLIQALGSTSPVACGLPIKRMTGSENPVMEELPVPENTLPPPFLFTNPSLLYIQNVLQALVIAASLRSLTRLPPPSSSGDGSDFMQRIWTLLTAEISKDSGPPSEDQGSTKLVNLADEVVWARKSATASDASTQSPPFDNTEETRLRAAVERTLQPSDAVFVLLQMRLLTALAERLSQGLDKRSEPATVPEHMQTGREGERAGKRPRLMLSPEDMHDSERFQPTERGNNLIVKGFEDPVLVKAVRETSEKIRECVAWIGSTWGNLVEIKTAGSVN